MPRRFTPLLFVAAIALGVSSCSQPAGVHIDVNLGDFSKNGLQLTVVLHSNKGFADLGPAAPDKAATATTEEFNGDDSPDVVVKFPGPFDPTKSFLVHLTNSPEVTVWAEAVLFDDEKVIATGRTTEQTLSPGGRLTLTLELEMPLPDQPPITPATRDTDLASDKPKVTTVHGPGVPQPAATSGIAAVAACDVNGDGRKDLVIGAPNVTARGVDDGAGVVYVAFAPFASSDVALKPDDPTQFTFYGATSGAHLGAAVACADLDGDAFDDFVVGAPDAELSGRVYGFQGRTAFATAKKTPDVVWGPASKTTAKFGSVLLAANLAPSASKKTTEIVVSAVGSVSDGVRPAVHVLRPALSTTLIDVDQADHVTISGVPAASLAAGDLDGTGGGIDLVLGFPTYKVPGDTEGSGAVVMFKDLDPTVAKALDGTLADVAAGYTTRMVGEPDTQFGKAVLVMNTRGAGDDLYVGAPTAGPSKRGLVWAFRHDDAFFPDGGVRNLKPESTPKLDAGDAGAHFGSSLAACASGSAGAPVYGLAVGGPDAKRVDARRGVGGAYLYSGGTGFNFSLLERMYGAAPDEHLGTAVACGQILDEDPAVRDAKADVVAVSPYADSGAGAAYLRASRP